MTSNPVECVPAMLLKPAEVAALLRISVRTLWRMVAANKLPRSVDIGNHRLLWKYTDLVQYINEL